MHQSMFGEGDGCNGYGEDLKKTQEDIVLDSVFAKADPEFRDKIHFEGQEDTLAAFVPDLTKKLPKPVDATTALTLTCRRGQAVDKTGVP